MMQDPNQRNKKREEDGELRVERYAGTKQEKKVAICLGFAFGL